MKIKRLETFLANAGLRNYLFVRLTTDTGLTGIGEASLEWQERAVQVLVEEWVAARLIGRDPFDIEDVIGGMVRDQYQGGATVMTAISGVELALWDLIGKACGRAGLPPDRRPRPGQGRGLCERLVWRLPDARRFRRPRRDRRRPRLSRAEVRPVHHGLEDLSREQEEAALAIVAAVAKSVGPAGRADDRDPRPARRR